MLARALDWAQGLESAQDRLAFYSAAEEGPTTLRLDRPPAGIGALPGAGLSDMPTASQPAKPKRPTTSASASQLEILTQTLPALTSRLASLEQQVSAGAAAPLAAPSAAEPPLPTQALGATPKLALPPRPKGLLASLGPPPGTRPLQMQTAGMEPSGQLQAELEELEAETQAAIPGSGGLRAVSSL